MLRVRRRARLLANLGEEMASSLASVATLAEASAQPLLAVASGLAKSADDGQPQGPAQPEDGQPRGLATEDGPPQGSGKPEDGLPQSAKHGQPRGLATEDGPPQGPAKPEAEASAQPALALTSYCLSAWRGVARHLFLQRLPGGRVGLGRAWQSISFCRIWETYNDMFVGYSYQVAILRKLNPTVHTKGAAIEATKIVVNAQLYTARSQAKDRPDRRALCFSWRLQHPRNLCSKRRA